MLEDIQHTNKSHYDSESNNKIKTPISISDLFIKLVI